MSAGLFWFTLTTLAFLAFLILVEWVYKRKDPNKKFNADSHRRLMRELNQHESTDIR